jgi:hypothetical protein
VRTTSKSWTSDPAHGSALSGSGWRDARGITGRKQAGRGMLRPIDSGGTAPESPPAGVGGGSCHPTTPSGNCYKRGEFCSEAEHGETGVAGDGETITCEPVGSYWRWE